MKGLQEAVSETKYCKDINTGEVINLSKELMKGIQIETDFHTYPATLVGGFIFFLGTTYNHELYLLSFFIEKQTEIAPRKATFTKNKKLVCHCFFFKGAVLFHVYNFFSSIFQIPKRD